jgi:ferritin
MPTSQNMISRLNDQMMVEFAASLSYLAMACSFEDMGLKVLSRRFFEQHSEEHEHGLKFLNYLHQIGAKAVIDALPKPRSDYDTVKAIVRAALESELDVTRRIHDLVALAEAEKDYATRSFLQWFVNEQVEEVSSMTDLLRLVELAGSQLLEVETRLRWELNQNNDD